MSEKDTQKFAALYEYNRAAGLEHDTAMRASNSHFVMKYAFMLQAVLLASFFVSFAIVLLMPWFAHAGGMERIHAAGWMLMGGTALGAYFPFKAKSVALWSLYGCVVALVAVLIFL